MQVLFRSCTTCYKHQHTSLQTSGGWVVVVGRRCRGVLSMWCPPPPTHPDSSSSTIHGTGSRHRRAEPCLAGPAAGG